MVLWFAQCVSASILMRLFFLLSVVIVIESFTICSFLLLLFIIWMHRMSPESWLRAHLSHLILFAKKTDQNHRICKTGVFLNNFALCFNVKFNWVRRMRCVLTAILLFSRTPKMQILYKHHLNSLLSYFYVRSTRILPMECANEIIPAPVRFVYTFIYRD